MMNDKIIAILRERGSVSFINCAVGSDDLYIDCRIALWDISVCGSSDFGPDEAFGEAYAILMGQLEKKKEKALYFIGELKK